MMESEKKTYIRVGFTPKQRELIATARQKLTTGSWAQTYPSAAESEMIQHLTVFASRRILDAKSRVDWLERRMWKFHRLALELEYVARELRKGSIEMAESGVGQFRPKKKRRR